MEVEHQVFEKVNQNDVSVTFTGGIQLQDLSNWMANSYEFIKNKRFFELIMPGTHDSITYKFMNFKRGPASDEMNKLFLCGDYLYCLFCCICNGFKPKTIVQASATT